MDDDLSGVVNPGPSSKIFRKNWARLIQKIYEVDPLICPKYRVEMRVIAFIEFSHIIERILKHLDIQKNENIWEPAKTQVFSSF